jgi:hypothetical protein
MRAIVLHGLVRELGVARTDDAVRKHLLADLGEHRRLHVDLSDDAEALGGERVWDLREGGLEVGAELLPHAVFHRVLFLVSAALA